MSSRGAAPSEPPFRRSANLLWIAILLTIAVTPLLVSPAAKSSFRLPKTLFFDAMMLLVFAGSVAWHLLGGSRSGRMASESHPSSALRAPSPLAEGRRGINTADATLSPSRINTANATLSPSRINTANATLSPSRINTANATLSPSRINTANATLTPSRINTANATLSPSRINTANATLSPSPRLRGEGGPARSAGPGEGLVESTPLPHRVPLSLAAAAVAWTAIVSMAALQPELARDAPLTAFSYAVLFGATILFARGGIALPFTALLLPAAINAIVTVLQALHLWTPIALDRTPQGRLAAMGLLGNPDYVGAYLMVPTLAAIAAAIAFKQHRRIFVAAAAILVTGIFFTQSVTAIGAFLVAAMSFAILVPSRPVRIAVATILLAVVSAIFAFRPTRERLFHMREFLRGGQLMELTSYRPPAVMVAIDMFRERPLLGVGPGNYEAGYMRHKLAVDERFPQWIRPMNANFGEAHNDHVQLLAESGLPGYLLYLGALACVASISFRRRRAPSQRAEFARVFALPAVVGFSVVGLAQFPLYLTVVTSAAIFASALAHVWSLDEGD